MPRTYTAMEVARRAGITPRMFDYWRRNGYFGDSHRFLGTGNHDGGYTDIDVDLVKLLGALSLAGIRVSEVWHSPRRRNGSIVTIHPSPAVTIMVDLSQT